MEKLNVKINFELSKLKMRDLLVQQGVQKVSTNKSKNPVGMSDDEWEELDSKSDDTIHLCLSDEVMFNIVGEETTTSLWNRIESLYMKISFTNMIFLRRKLYAPQMDEGMEIPNHLNTFNDLICQLTSLDEKSNEDEKTMALLRTLPDS